MLNPFRFTEINANVRPARLAFDDGSSVLTWRQFHALATRIAAKLATLGVRPGQLVVTCLPAGMDWIFTNALFHEACITCSNHQYQPIDPVLEVDWIITSQAQAHFPVDRVILIDEPWFADLKEAGTATRPRDYADADAPCRLVLTSGTTGQARAGVLTVGALERRLRGMPAYWSVAGGELNLMGLMTVSGFMTAMAGAVTADAFFAPNAPDRIALIRKHGIRSLLGSPVQLGALLQALHRRGEQLPSIKEVRSAGGALPPPLVKALRTLPGAELYNVYGASEVGGVSFCTLNEKYDAAIAGFLLDGVDVEIVDDGDLPVAPQAEGHVRIRTPGMMTHYHRNPEASARAFRDGWFYPGDRGRLMKSGLLLLAGRSSELFNRGGVKINPTALDAFLLAYPGLSDAAAFALTDARGLPQPAVALVAAAGFNQKQLHDDMVKAFGPAKAPRYFFAVEKIPRNAMGKVMRAKMSQAFANVVRERDGEKLH